MQELGQSFGTLNWAIVIAYLVGNLALGWAMSRRISSAEDYNFGDRSTPWWAIGISVIATYVSALSFLGGGVNLVVSWSASVALGGFQKEWHEHSVPGQLAYFEATGKPRSEGGWYVVPGLAEAPVWGLLIAFAAILLFLVWFGTLG